MNIYQKYLKLSVAMLVAVCFALTTKASTAKPDHLVVMVFDQMRPDYIDRYDLKNFKKLRNSGLNYKNAFVGHMGSETVVSHFVISSGLLPKHMPWHDEVFYDHRNLLGGGDLFYSTGGLNTDQFMTLMKQVDQKNLLPFKLKQRFTNGKVFSIGQKAYAATTFGTPSADSIITFRKSEGVCTPNGINVPNYIATNPRFTVECKNDFGTKNSLYPLDGARSVPGTDSAHQGGDVWVADVARTVIDNEPEWRGLFLTFAGIDKVGHMTGEVDVKMPLSFDSKYSVPDVLRIADAQLGRILSKLDEKKLLQKTLIVITADHGAQSNNVYLGNGQKSHGGEDLVNDRSSPQAYFVDRLLRTNRVRVTYQDTAMRLWLHKTPSVTATTSDSDLYRTMSETSGLVEIYRLTENKGQYAYTRVYQNLAGRSPEFKRWAITHNQDLVNSMAAPGSADVIGLLADGFGFDLPGDHGGAQERVQRIPIIFNGPGVTKGQPAQELRLVDINNKISAIMGL